MKHTNAGAAGVSEARWAVHLELKFKAKASIAGL
jgi:hypothetical protein